MRGKLDKLILIMVITMSNNEKEMDLTELNAEIFSKLRSIESRIETIIDLLAVNAMKTYADNKGIDTSEELLEDWGIEYCDENDGEIIIAERVMYYTKIGLNNERISCLIKDVWEDMKFIRRNLRRKIDFVEDNPSNTELLEFLRIDY